jgi:starvation-inducible outer membrane lipoprotein
MKFLLQIWVIVFIVTLAVLCVFLPSRPQQSQPHPCQIEDQLDTPTQQQNYERKQHRLAGKIVLDSK